MTLSDSQRRLIETAEGFVREFIQKRGEFTMFAIARQPDGSDQILQSSGEFSSFTEEIAGMFQVLRPLAKDGVIEGSVLCSPFEDRGTRFAILDVETRANGRCIIMLPYKKKMFGGWSFGDWQYNEDTPRVFAP
jgi:hypothetical protein